MARAYVVGLLIGFACGCLAGGLFVYKDQSNALVACEKELPRDQHCVIIAVPEQDKAYD